MITALASDYYSVYYVDLDKGEGVCYQAHEDVENGFREGERFTYLDSVTAYAKAYIKEEYIDEFLNFIQPENVKDRLKEQRVIAHRYMVHRHDRDTWEEVRFAGVRHPEDRNDHLVHAVGACFVDVDREVRRQRITARLHSRLQEGMVEEVRKLLGTVSADDLIYYGLEYKYLTLYCIGELSYEEMVRQLEIAIHQFAKRQMTWFRGMERRGTPIHWIDAAKDMSEKVDEILTLMNS